jgi:polyhydroxyalkanoate synthesis repressor PhaR
MSIEQGQSDPMTTTDQPIVIKKYANRRLYHTGTSTYVTLEDLATMVKRGDNFAVFDAKSGEDITRSVLAQIIFDQEGKEGQNLLPINFLRQLISYYGDSMQAFVPTYLENSIKMLTENQSKFRDQFASTFGKDAFGMMEELGQKNMEMFREAFSMFSPFTKMATPGTINDAEKPASTGETSRSDDLTTLKQQIAEMQKKLDRMGGA